MDKVSLERLKELAGHLGNRNAEFGLTFNYDDTLDAADAIRELIALREAEPVAVPSFLVSKLEKACHSAEHPTGMSVHDGKCKVDASDIRYLLKLLSAPLIAKPC